MRCCDRNSAVAAGEAKSVKSTAGNSFIRYKNAHLKKYYGRIHIIPRYKGDVENSQGGTRHVIAKKAHYAR